MLQLEKRLPLHVKLIGATVLAILVVLLITYALLNRALTDLFRDFQVEGGRMRAGEVKELLANYYANQGNWHGVDALIGSRHQAIQDAVTGRSILLATPDGQVIASSSGQRAEERLGSEALADGVPIEVNGRPVGMLLVGPVVDNYSPREVSFLRAVHQSLLVSGLVGLVVAVLVGVLLLRRWLAPLRTLTQAVHAIRGGRLHQWVPAETQDELGALASAFNDMARHLKRSEQIRRNMITDIAHELRTPITAVQCSLEAMLANSLEPTLENVAPIYDQALLLGRLVRDLQELSLAEAGELSLQKNLVDPVKMLQKIAITIRPQLEDQGVTLHLQVPTTLPPLEVDGGRIEQVLLNLLSNAQRHTPAGGEIALTAQETSRGHLELRVSDTGMGIPPEELPYVFQRFYRGDRSRTRGGSGLGLAIAKRLVKAHGGRIWVESQPERGTTFKVILPGGREPLLPSRAGRGELRRQLYSASACPREIAGRAELSFGKRGRLPT